MPGLARLHDDPTRMPTEAEFDQHGPRLWGRLLGDEKSELLAALVSDQGGLCCYCQRRIALLAFEVPEECHVEHLLPRSCFPRRIFDSRNLAASCQEAAADPPRVPAHCGATKGNWPAAATLLDFISPRDPDCNRHFDYQADGRVLPRSDSSRATAAAETIHRLKLDLPLLRSQRASAIEPFLDSWQEGIPVEEILRAVRTADAEGRFAPFAAVVEAVLCSV